MDEGVSISWDVCVDDSFIIFYFLFFAMQQVGAFLSRTDISIDRANAISDVLAIVFLEKSMVPTTHVVLLLAALSSVPPCPSRASGFLPASNSSATEAQVPAGAVRHEKGYSIRAR